MNAGPTLTLDAPEVAACLECLLPAGVGTASEDGIPNVTWLSLVQRVDRTHVGLSRQFFRKTARNIAGNQRLQLLVLHPMTGRQFHLNLEYERTETDGSHYESMRARLDAVASQSGMSRVFRLKGLDICRVVSIDAVPTEQAAPAPADTLAAPPHERLRALTDEINAASDVEELITRALAALDRHLGYRHAMLLLVDAAGEHLYMVASRGYPTSGAGAEVRMGEGHIGIAAERRQSILATNLAKDLAYSGAVRRSATQSGQGKDLTREIPLPGLQSVMSQLVVPVLAPGRLLGVLCLQSDRAGRFHADDEHVVSVAAAQIGLAMALLQVSPTVEGGPWRIAVPPADVPPVEVAYYSSDDSVLVDNEYLIKGVAGRILWRLLRQYSERHRVDFSNKEMRLDQSLALPELNDNLEARLVLLRRRLQDRCTFIHIIRTGRGRFRLNVDRPLSLVEHD